MCYRNDHSVLLVGVNKHMFESFDSLSSPLLTPLIMLLKSRCTLAVLLLGSRPAERTACCG